MDIDEEQDAKPAALKDLPVYNQYTKPTYTNYGTGKRWTDDSSESESEDDIKITKVVPPSIVKKNYQTPSTDIEYDNVMETDKQIPAVMKPVAQIPVDQAKRRAPNESTYIHSNEFPPSHSADETNFSRLLPIKIS